MRRLIWLLLLGTGAWIAFWLYIVRPWQPTRNAVGAYLPPDVANPLDRDHAGTAYREKLPVWKARFAKLGLAFPPKRLFIRAFKREACLEVWTSNGAGQLYRKLITYPIAASSGTLGPKRKQGDLQVPEGFYAVQSLNPKSAYYLSIKLNYPNTADKILGDRTAPGSDIFIHGKRVTIGCIPITDEYIKELWVLVSESRKASAAPIPVHIFPCHLGSDGWTSLKAEYAKDAKLLSFWSDLKRGYDAFTKSQVPPRVVVSTSGQYRVNP